MDKKTTQMRIVIECAEAFWMLKPGVIRESPQDIVARRRAMIAAAQSPAERIKARDAAFAIESDGHQARQAVAMVAARLFIGQETIGEAIGRKRLAIGSILRRGRDDMRDAALRPILQRFDLLVSERLASEGILWGDE